MPLPLLEKAGQEGLRAVHNAPEVHAERPLPVLRRCLPDGAVHVTFDAGVVADEVNAAKLLQCLDRELLDPGRGRNIRIAAEALGQGPAYAARSSRDDRDFTGELSHG